jgi:hypothetical protein
MSVVNPTTFTVTDPTFATDAVTGMRLLFGSATGGPYPTVVNVPASDIAEVTGGVVTGKVADLHLTLPGGIYYVVAQAVNGAGVSGNSPEYGPIQILPLPAAPTSFTMA